ncbi:hypothetical protein ILUMI_11473 [Ignelater luminosus]|uniref:Peptidase S1 domain-containing protein n=1 Tax=Ignelater luminosus TaxID=2038154 RepID=A0A8K0GAG9_IGNLU|nr:hypothetical protein ILUMI_11473 [Ignelater luminosus]
MLSRYLAAVVIIVLHCSCLVLSAKPFIKTIDPSLSWRIIGGSDAPEGLYPYQVSLRRKQLGPNVRSAYVITESSCEINKQNTNPLELDTTLGYHTCGGSILNSDYVLTAAHCVSYESPSDFYVVVGSNKLNSGGTTHAVTEIHWHSGFSIWHGQNDIAVLKVSPSIIFTKTINSVILEQEEIGSNETVVLSGWGSTDFPGRIPEKLQHINLETVSNEYCKSLHQLPVSEHQICTSTIKGEGACKGDSGGPLVKTYPSGEVRQVGIVSFGRKCAKGYPDVFTKTSSFISWIRDKCNNCV